MSMGPALEGTRDYLREHANIRNKPGAENKRVTIEFNLFPPPMASNWHIALDDGGIETGNQVNNELVEVLTLMVGIWKRPGGVAPDRQGNLMLETDLYQRQVSTIEQLERAIIKTLHENHAVDAYINTKFGLPVAGLGDAFGGRWVYRGRQKMESVALPDYQGSPVWIGRRLRFTGLKRTQRVSNMG